MHSRFPTMRQAYYWQVIRDLYWEKGCPPTVREIAPRVGVASMNAVHQVIQGLIRLGKLRMAGKRTLVPVEDIPVLTLEEALAESTPAHKMRSARDHKKPSRPGVRR